LSLERTMCRSQLVETDWLFLLSVILYTRARMLSQKLHAEVARAAALHYQLAANEVEVTVTRDLEHGDYTTNVALRVAAKWGVTPREAAATIVKVLQESPVLNKLCAHIAVAGPGFINFHLKPEAQVHAAANVLNPRECNSLKGRRVIVEYSSPNVAKPMHVGHIRSTIIGAALAAMYERLGAQVTTLNHLGDWGTQFGKLITAYKRWGSRAKVKKDPIGELLKLYVRFHEVLPEHPELEKDGQEEFHKLEGKNRENRALWRWFRQESLKEFGRMYKRLGVYFDAITGESFYEPMLKAVVADLLKRKLAVKNEDGSVVVHLQAEGLPPALIQKSDGASLYATRDLAAIRYRLQRYRPEKIVYVIGNEQSLHFEQVFAVARLAGYAGSAELVHVKFGLILGSDGQKLSTREGKTVPLEQVMDEAHTRARAVVEAKNPKLTTKQRELVAEVVGIGAVKYNDLHQNRLTDITFDWNKMLGLDGNSAPYLQYTYVRMKSILRNVGKTRVGELTALSFAHGSAEDQRLVRFLGRYPEYVRYAVEEHGPHLLANYLYELSNLVNSYYHTQQVLKAEPKVRSLRLTLVRTAAEVIADGLDALGVGVVERM
jgi:arginyl-tRNA synthetase